jgi:hypothetical protein
MRSRQIRNSRQAARGQVMPLFALFAVLLLVIAGLAIDAGMSYLSSDQVERAAAAAALAGVAYLPGDVADATNAALVEAARNGFANAGVGGTSCPGNPSPCVLISQPATNELKVQISVSVPTTFLQIVGFGPHTVTRSATAQYLPPVALGEPGAEQGSVLGMDGSVACNGISGTYCATLTSGLGSGGSNFYFERTEGWGNPRSEGDAFTPTSLDEATSCGTPAILCVASPADYHQISPMYGTETYYPALDLNYTGGSSYLISVPPGQSVDVQVYNPSFAPDSNDQSTSTYTYHEDDTSFSDGSTTASDYAAMAYTIFTVPTLSSDMGDTPISQEVFYPFNATCIYDNGASCGGTQSYKWFPPASGNSTPVSGVPNIYHAWTSVLDTPAGNDSNLFKSTLPLGTDELTNTNPSGGANMYWRLEVDTLQWNGTPTCTSSTCSLPKTAGSFTNTNGQSKVHKGYAVQLAVPGTTNECTSATCSTSTISAMGDMIVYTPINAGSSPASFSIPLFQLDPSYAGQTIDVDIFDPGDVSYMSGHSGSAYMGIQQPDGSWATASIKALGNSLGASGSTSVSASWPTAACGTGYACFQTANSSGNAIYNGQWLQLQVTVPGSLNTSSPSCSGSTEACWSNYWNLVYYVSAYATAGDTFSVQAGYNGSPDRLLP